MLPECPADTVQGDRIRTTVGEGQTEAHHAEDVPKVIIVFLCIGTAKKKERRNTNRY